MESFNSYDAVKHGVEKAVLISVMKDLIEENVNYAADEFTKDGYVWTCNTSAELSKIMPYYKQNKIQRMLKQLVDSGVIKIGNYNKNTYDRSLWYSFEEFKVEDYTVLLNKYIGSPQGAANIFI